MQDPVLRAQLRTIVRGGYDLQRLRIQTGNRVVSNIKVRMGIEPGTKEEDEKEADKFLDQIREQYARITDFFAENPKAKSYPFDGEGIIADETEFQLAKNYMALLNQEEETFGGLTRILKRFPIYNQFLVNVKGCGPMMSAIIIAEIDIHLATYPSTIWAYAGLDVGPDGRGRNRSAEHLVERIYENKKGEQDTRMGITFNPFLKTKLIGVLGSGMLKAGIRNEKDTDGKVVMIDGKKNQRATNKYTQVYLDYKHRLEHHAIHKDKTPLHRHNMATRYMVKMFLLDMWTVWRGLENLPIPDPYHVAKLGLRSHVA
jgi:hypothetical protein